MISVKARMTVEIDGNDDVVLLKDLFWLADSRIRLQEGGVLSEKYALPEHVDVDGARHLMKRVRAATE